LTAGLIGVVSGVWSVVFPTAVASLLTPQQRGDLFLRFSGYGAALVVLVTAYSARYILGRSPELEDAELLGIGAAAMTLAAASGFLLRSEGAVFVSVQRPVGEVLHEGYRFLRHERWLRRYVMTNWLFTVVTLGPMFYGIYAAETLGSGNGELDVILVFFGLGLLAGIPVWRQVRKRFDYKGMFLLSGLISASVAVLLIFLRASHILPPVMTFGVVMLLAAVANQPLYVAGQDWLFSHTPEDARMVILALSQIVLSMGTIVASFGIAMLASDASGTWPLVVMLCISAVALLTALAEIPH
jgi:predicted MFS family arabinose efflux permease